MVYSFLNRLIIPLSLLVLALFVREPLLDVAPVYQSLLVLLPYWILALTLLLALYFNRTRRFGLALLLLGGYAVIHLYLQVSLSQPDALLMYTALSFGVPLAAPLLLFLPEKGLRSIWGLLPMFCAVAPALILYALLLQYSSHSEVLLQPWPLSLPLPYYLSMPASVLYILCFLISLWPVGRHNSEYAAAVCSVLLFTFVTFAFFKLDRISLVMFTAASVSVLISLVRSAHELAFRDELTGLRSRRTLNERLRSLGRHYVIAMVDVDHFKQCNDRYGHDVGDHVLKMVAAQLDKVKGAAAYRYGGEEFCLLFPGKDYAYCEPVLEALRESIAGYSLYLRDMSARPESAQKGRQQRKGEHHGRAISVTVSIGAAEKNINLPESQAVLKAADTALYQAKKKGRNRLVLR